MNFCLTKKSMTFQFYLFDSVNRMLYFQLKNRYATSNKGLWYRIGNYSQYLIIITLCSLETL